MVLDLDDPDRDRSKESRLVFQAKGAVYGGDKAQVKGLKVSPHLKVDFVPVEYPEPRRIRASFKKLMQATAMVNNYVAQTGETIDHIEDDALRAKENAEQGVVD